MVISPDWVAAIANAVLAASAVLASLAFVWKWPVGFRVEAAEAPIAGQSVIEGVERPPDFGWSCRLVLVSGRVAHIGSVVLLEKKGWRWAELESRNYVYERLPRSVGEGEALRLMLVTDQDSKSRFKVKVNEYRSLRSVTLPFLAPEAHQ